MGKLRIGPSANVIRASNGAPSRLNNFYSTAYQTNYGISEFTPSYVKPSGTGYKANFRPDVYYTNQLDQLDNVQLGKELTKNYLSSYVKQYSLYTSGSDGNDKLPLRTFHRKSGFTEKDPISTANTKNVIRGREDTMTGSVHKPLLQRLHNKKVAHLDDGSMNPATESSTCYLGKPSVRMSTFMKDVGCKEPSGFTHFHHFDPILFLDRAPFNGARDGRKTLRPTGNSENQTEFVRWPALTGKEVNAGVRNRSKRDTGYCTETTRPRFVHRIPNDAFANLDQMPPPTASRVRKQDPCEYLNLTKGAVHNSVAACNFEGIQRNPTSAEQRLSRASTGSKESTGFSTNNGRHVETTDQASRFHTHYSNEFANKRSHADPAPVCEAAKPTNGFSKSTVVHSFGDRVSFRPTSLSSLHPHAARAMKLEHPCYVDGTRNLKLSKPLKA